MKKIIDVAEVSKTFGKGTNINKVLDNCSLCVNEGEFVSSWVLPDPENPPFFI